MKTYKIEKPYGWHHVDWEDKIRSKPQHDRPVRMYPNKITSMNQLTR